MAIGWKEVGRKWYYLNNSGSMVTGKQRISGIDYYFYPSSGALAYDASTYAAVFKKEYHDKKNDIDTNPDYWIIKDTIDGDYAINWYKNFSKSTFMEKDGPCGITNMNKGILIYTGHGSENGVLVLGDEETLTPYDVSRMELNNTKIVLFFACYGGLENPIYGKSIVSAEVEAGARAAYGYKVELLVIKDRQIEREILDNMVNEGMTFRGAVSEMKNYHPFYKPVNDKNLVLKGNLNVRLSCRNQMKSQEELQVPELFEEENSEENLLVFRKKYNGYYTTDLIIYDKEEKNYTCNNNEFSLEKLKNINYDKVKENEKIFSKTLIINPQPL